MVIQQFFPPELLELQAELVHHEDVMAALSVTEDKSLGGILASLCTIFDIVIDGTFDEKQIKELATILTKELYQRRTLIVTLH